MSTFKLAIKVGSSFLFPHYRAKKNWVSNPISQEKNTRAMEKEVAQSDIPVKRKIQKTIQKYHIS